MPSTLNRLTDARLSGGTAVVRLDLNMPMCGGQPTDVTRLQRSIPTLRFLIEKGAIPVILSHFGRPHGQVVPEMSLAPVRNVVSRAIDGPVIFVPTTWKDDLPLQFVSRACPGETLLMENTRFHPGEEANDLHLGQKMAALGRIYVNDAFSVAHRAHASTEAITHSLPSVAGYAMAAELDALDTIFGTVHRPLIGLIGGAKISTKLRLISHLATRMDSLVIAGGMANTLLAACGISVGASLCEPELLNQARQTVEAVRRLGCELVLPLDAIVAESCKAYTTTRSIPIHEVGPADMILDIGPLSIARIKGLLGHAQAVVWNGPLGAFETPPFDQGTREVASEVARLSRENALVSIAGGGDTVAALRQAGVSESLSYVSTGGGAFLAWLEGSVLPAIRPLFTS